MAEATRSGFRGSKGSGLPETMILRNTTAELTRHATYHGGKTLVLLVRGQTEDVKDANGDEIEGYDIDENPLIYPVGPGFDSFDSGRTAEHESGKADKMPHENSGISVFCQALVDLGLEDQMAERGETMLEAAVFEGWDLYLERREFDFGKNKEGNEMKTSRMIPTKVLGDGKAAGGKAASKASKPAAKAAKAVEEEASEDEGGLLANIDSKTLAKLKVAFKKADGDAGAFADLAIDVDGVTDDDDLVTAVADGSLWAELGGE